MNQFVLGVFLALFFVSKVHSSALPSYRFHTAKTEIFFGIDCFEDMLQMVKSAEKYVWIDFYIFGGPYAERIVDELIHKKTEGVDIRVMLDRRLGSVPTNWKETKPIVNRLLKNNIPFAYYTEEPFEKGMKKSIDHNKVILVDDRVASVGSTNFSTLFLQYHDLSIRIEESGVIQDLKKQYDLDWRISRGQIKMSLLNQRVKKSSPAPMFVYKNTEKSFVRLLSNGPGRSNIKEAMIRSIEQARESIDVLVHEFDEKDLENALLRAHRRGVKVRVLLDPWRVTEKFVPWLSLPTNVPNLGALKKLKNAGVDVRAFRVSKEKLVAHMKMMLIDREVLHAGSANWAFGSWEHLAETNLEIIGGKATKDAQSQFDFDWLRNSEPTFLPKKFEYTLFKLYQWARKNIIL